MTTLPASQRGFTLLEMIVSIGIFTIVLFVASSAFLAVVNADRKSRATRTAMDNLTVALEDMSRRIKTGNAYTCGGDIASVAPVDCLNTPSSSLAFTDQDGKRTAYRLREGRIFRQIATGSELPVTASEITISSLLFAVGGTIVGDNTQPYVRISITGATTGGITASNFNAQTMITQRVYDF